MVFSESEKRDSKTQSGSGPQGCSAWNQDEFEQLAIKVAEKINTTEPFRKKVDLVQPGPSTVDVQSVNQVPGPDLGATVDSDSQSSKYFDEQLILSVAKKDRPSATILLTNLRSRSAEFTYSPTGVVFLDGISIPESNFYLIFPQLFRYTRSTKIAGLLEVINKIKAMSLDHLIFQKKRKSFDIKPEQPKTETDLSNESDNKKLRWYYIGP